MCMSRNRLIIYFVNTLRAGRQPVVYFSYIAIQLFSQRRIICLVTWSPFILSNSGPKDGQVTANNTYL